MSKAVKAIKKVVKKVSSVVTGKEPKGSPVLPGAKKVIPKADQEAQERRKEMEFSRRAGNSRRRTVLSSENLG